MPAPSPVRLHVSDGYLRVLDASHHTHVASLASSIPAFLADVSAMSSTVQAVSAQLHLAADAVDEARLHAIGQRHLCDDEVSVRAAACAELSEAQEERMLVLSHLRMELDALLQVERAQQSTIDRMLNGGVDLVEGVEGI